MGQAESEGGSAEENPGRVARCYSWVREEGVSVVSFQRLWCCKPRENHTGRAEKKDDSKSFFMFLNPVERKTFYKIITITQTFKKNGNDEGDLGSFSFSFSNEIGF